MPVLTIRALGLLAESQPIFYIVEIPPHAGGCGCVPVSSLDRPPHQVWSLTGAFLA